MSNTLILHTDAHTIRDRLILKDVERFRNGPVHESSLIALITPSSHISLSSKVLTSSHETTNDRCTNPVHEISDRSMGMDLTTNCDAKLKTSNEKIKNLCEQNFKGEAIKKFAMLDNINKDDTQRSNLKSKYLSLTLALNILFLLIFFDFNNLRLDTIYIITP